jgi:hypothetical protein
MNHSALEIFIDSFRRNIRDASPFRPAQNEAEFDSEPLNAKGEHHREYEEKDPNNKSKQCLLYSSAPVIIRIRQQKWFPINRFATGIGVSDLLYSLAKELSDNVCIGVPNCET